MTTRGYTVLGWLAYQVLSRVVMRKIAQNKVRVGAVATVAAVIAAGIVAARASSEAVNPRWRPCRSWGASRCAPIHRLRGGLAACAISAPSALADSIVYEKGGNVWAANPDGSGQRQVTTSGGYSHPSQANDGTIVG